MEELEGISNKIELGDLERAKRKFGLETALSDALDLIRKDLPIQNFSQLLGEDLWLREVLKDLEQVTPCPNCKAKCGAARTKALSLFGEWLGVLGSKSKKKSKRDVVFDDGE